MQAPHRTLRTIAEDRARQPHELSPREHKRREHILATALTIMAVAGAHAVTLSGLAFAMHLAPAALRRHFADIDSILAELLRRHLRALAEAIGAIPPDAPDPHAARRAAYFAFTRAGHGGFTAGHTLLVRDRYTLAPDLRDDIETIRGTIGLMLSPNYPGEALALLDAPELPERIIEIALAACALPPPAEHLTRRLNLVEPEPREPNYIITAEDLARWAPDSFPQRQNKKGRPGALPLDQAGASAPDPTSFLGERRATAPPS